MDVNEGIMFCHSENVIDKGSWGTCVKHLTSRSSSDWSVSTKTHSLYERAHIPIQNTRVRFRREQVKISLTEMEFFISRSAIKPTLAHRSIQCNSCKEILVVYQLVPQQLMVSVATIHNGTFIHTHLVLPGRSGEWVEMQWPLNPQHTWHN